MTQKKQAVKMSWKYERTIMSSHKADFNAEIIRIYIYIGYI